MLVPGEKQVSLVALAHRDDLALDTCFAGEQTRSIDVRACPLPLRSNTERADCRYAHRGAVARLSLAKPRRFLASLQSLTPAHHRPAPAAREQMMRRSSDHHGVPAAGRLTGASTYSAKRTGTPSRKVHTWTDL